MWCALSLFGVAGAFTYVYFTQKRIAQLIGEKERLDFERRMQRHKLAGRDDSMHAKNNFGVVLGPMQDQAKTNAQQEAAKPFDEMAMNGSPHSVMIPLFIADAAKIGAEGWIDSASNSTLPRSPSAGSSLMNCAPSLCESDALLPISEAVKNAPLHWAPPPPKSPFFRSKTAVHLAASF